MEPRITGIIQQKQDTYLTIEQNVWQQPQQEQQQQQQIILQQHEQELQRQQ